MHVEHISEKLGAMADALYASIGRCPRLVHRKKTPGRKRKESLSFSERGIAAIRQAWFEELRRLQLKQPDSFISAQATLEDDSRAVKSKLAYAALPITQFNNSDIREIYVTEYDRKVRSRSGYRFFTQLVTVAGQFLRLHVLLGFTEVKTCCDPGALYRALCDRAVIDIFLNSMMRRPSVRPS